MLMPKQHLCMPIFWLLYLFLCGSDSMAFGVMFSGCPYVDTYFWWTWNLRKTLTIILHIWHKYSLGLKNELILMLRGQWSNSLWLHHSRPCDCDISGTLWGSFIKFCANITKAWLEFGGQRSKLLWSHISPIFVNSISAMLWGNFFKFGANVHLDPRMNWLNFLGHCDPF